MTKMKLSEFSFDLPEDLIAEYPTENRDESRLMVIHRDTGKIEHKLFKDVINYFTEGDTLIMNNTKVFPARMYGNKEKTGAKIEVFLLRELNRESLLWDVLVDPARKIRIGNKLYFGEDDSLVAEVIDNTTSRGRTLRFLFDGTYEEFKAKIAIAKEEILAGEAFQIVLSQRFSMSCTAEAIDVYRMLRLNNPSPYMYLFRFIEGVTIVGSSPEALVKVNDREVMIHPIAGTRKRSSSPEEDHRLGEELLADPKERAEHLMLVDLGRNDLGRVCAPGSVEVIDFMHIERYSHVMHIVSTVTGKLADTATPVDALFSVFPAGTLSGAPKPRAMEIIEQLEPTRRGVYGGIVGYIDFTGNIDTCIAIRTALIREGIAYVQAGAGIVADSDPESENQECRNKAAAVLMAIDSANRLRKN